MTKYKLPNALHMTRREWFGQVVCAVASSHFMPVLAQTDAPKVLRVGFISRYEPYSFTDPKGELTGFDVEVVRALLAHLGWQMVTVTDRMQNLQQKVAQGELDFIGNQLLTTPENRRRFDFVRAYASIQLVCVQHESDNNDYLSLDDLLGKKLGVLANTGVEDQARGALGRAVQAFDRIEAAFKALADKKIDAVLEENLIAEYHIDRDRLPLRVGAPFAAPLKVGLAVPKGQQALLTQLSSAVQTLTRDKSFQGISGKWFGYDVSKPRVSHAQSS